METKEKEQKKKFNDEIAKLLQLETNSSIPQKLEVLLLDELPDLSEWRDK